VVTMMTMMMMAVMTLKLRLFASQTMLKEIIHVWKDVDMLQYPTLLTQILLKLRQTRFLDLARITNASAQILDVKCLGMLVASSGTCNVKHKHKFADLCQMPLLKSKTSTLDLLAPLLLQVPIQSSASRKVYLL
jgi:hypothetical protein